MKFAVSLFLIIFNLIASAQSIYHDYQSKMIDKLKTLLENNDSLIWNSLPIASYTSDTLPKNLYNRELELEIHEKCITGESEDVRYFLGISSMLTSSIEAHLHVFTKNDIDSIESWWKSNEGVVTPDFLKDILWTYGKIFLDYGFYHKGDFRDSAIHRITERIKNRHKTPYRDIKPIYNSIFPKSNSIKQNIFAIQENIHRYFIDDAIIESIIPTGTQTEYVYLTKKLMSGEEYQNFTPVSRKEFEDMRDWWFVNSEMVDNSMIPKILTEFKFKDFF
ncbi:MAG: hypothetical protein K2L14_10070 [Duncaniella sp.]|nr:hypothetical protein [Duncaniella sp.]